MELNNVRIDTNKRVNGVWFTYGDAKFKIAKFGDPSQYSYEEELFQELNQSIDSLSQKQLDEIRNKSIAKYVVKDWEGITLEGVTYACNYKNCLDLITNPDFIEIRTFIIEKSVSTAKYKKEVLDKRIKK